MNKVVASAEEAIRDMRDNMTIMVGGFGLCGIPEKTIAAMVKKGIRGLTCISNNAGVDDLSSGARAEVRCGAGTLRGRFGGGCDVDAGLSQALCGAG